MPITYRFQVAPKVIDGPSAIFVVDGLSLTVKSIVDSDGAGPTPPAFVSTVNRNGAGLGVTGAPGVDRVGIRNNGTDREALFFDFAPEIVTIIDSVLFETGPQAGSLDFFADGAFQETISWSANLGDTFFTHTFSGPTLTGSSFEFRAMQDNFRIARLTVEYAVPEPTSLALLGFGLAGIGYRRHRNKKSA